MKCLNSDSIRNVQFDSVFRLMKNMTFSMQWAFAALDIVVYFNICVFFAYFYVSEVLVLANLHASNHHLIQMVIYG